MPLCHNRMFWMIFSIIGHRLHGKLIQWSDVQYHFSVASTMVQTCIGGDKSLRKTKKYRRHIAHAKVCCRHVIGAIAVECCVDSFHSPWF